MANVTVTLTLDDDTVVGSFSSDKSDEELLMAIQIFCSRQNYQSTFYDVDGNPSENPESMGNFLIRKMKEYAESEIKAEAIKQAQAAAKAQVEAYPFEF